MTLDELGVKRGAVVAELRTMVDNDAMNEEQSKQFDAKQAELAEIDKQITRKKLVEAEEAKQAELATPAEKPTPRGAAPYHKAKYRPDDELRIYERWLRTGDTAIMNELRASNATDMNIGTPADGGYTVPTGLYNEIVAKRDEAAIPMAVGVRRITGRGTTIRVPLDNEADGEFVTVGEATEFDLDAPALSYVDLTKVKYTKQLKLSYELLEDEDSNLLPFITDFVGRGLAKTYNSLFVTEALSGGTASLTFDSASTIGAAEIPELYHKQASEYVDGSVWVMNRTTEGLIRGLTGNPFLYVPTPAGTQSGRPEIWGAPVYNTGKMSAIAASVKSVIFGNFNFMGMYEDPGLTFMRDPYSLAYLGQVRLLYYFRIDFEVLQAEAIHYGTHPTA